MSNALTGGFDAVLEMRQRTVRRFLAAMHEHAGDIASDQLPRLLHNRVFQIGDDGAVGGVHGKVQAQLGVPRIELIVGSEIGPASEGKVRVIYPVRAWFRPYQGTTPFPSFIHGDLHATFRVTLEVQPSGSVLRFTPSANAAEFSFVSPELSAGAAGQVAQQAQKYLQDWSAKEPFLVILGDLDFPLLAKGVGEAIAVALPLPDGATPPVSLAGVSQDFTTIPTAGPADFALAVSREYVLGLVQPFLDQVKASHPTFKVDFPSPVPDATYTVHVHKAEPGWKPEPAGSYATITLSFEGDATTPGPPPNADWSVALKFVLSFDDASKTLVLTAGDLVVNVDVHGPFGSLVEDSAESKVKGEVKKKRDAALPGIQAGVAAALPPQVGRLTSLLHQLVSYVTVSVKGANFESDGVVLYGSIGLAPRKKAPQVIVSELPDGSGYSAFANWIPGGFISSYTWHWTTWTIDPLTGQPTIKPEPGPLPGTHVWPHEEKSLSDRFVLQQGPGIDLPGLGAGTADSPLWTLCLYVKGTQVDPVTGDDAAYPLNPWGPLVPDYEPPEAVELITSLDVAGVHPGTCWLGETGTPEVLGVWPKQYPGPDPEMVAGGLWVEWTWLDHDSPLGGGTYTAHVDLLAQAALGPSMRGRATVFQFLAEGSAPPALQPLDHALREAQTATDSMSVVLVRPPGPISAASASAIRAFARDHPGVRVRVYADIQGSWSRMLQAPANPHARGATRVMDTAGRLVFHGDGALDAEALSRTLGQLDVQRAPARVGPLVPTAGPGVPPGDLLIEVVPGQPLNLRHLRRRPLALAFAREWSTPCRAALKELAVAQRGLSQSGVTVLGVLTGAGTDHAKAFGAREGLPFPILADPDARIARLCAIRLWPTILLLDGERHVRARAGASSSALAASARAARPGG